MIIVHLVSMFRVVAGVIGVMLCSVACQPLEEGYWTKPDVSQSMTNEQYPNDSEHCDQVASQNSNVLPAHTKGTLYTKCMHGRGYQWIVERPHSRPAISVGDSSIQVLACPTGRVIIDAFGYNKCVPAGKKDRATTPETIAQVGRKASPAQRTDDHPPKPDEQANEPWVREDRICRQHAQDSLSSPYSVYAQCMQEQGWSAGSP
jgi:hypothetical protein